MSDSDSGREILQLPGKLAAGTLTSFEILARAIEAMEIGITICDASGRIAYTNAVDARMHGYEVAELIGQKAAIFAASVSDAESGRPATGSAGWLREQLNRRRDGSLFPVRLFSESLVDESGKPIATVTLCEDVSAAAEAARSIARRDGILQSIAQMTERILAANDLEWRETLTACLSNLRSAAQVEGAAFFLDPVAVLSGPRFRGSIVVGSTTCDWSHELWTELLDGFWENEPEPVIFPQQGAELPEALRLELSRSGISHALFVPAITSSGILGVVVLLASAGEHRWSTGELDALRIVARLIGAWYERSRTEKTLASVEESFMHLVEAGSDLFQQLSDDGRILYVNPAWCSVLGYSNAEALRLSIFDVVDPAHQEAFRARIGPSALARRPEPFQTIFRSRDGRALVVEGNVSLRELETGAMTSIGIFRDVTERVELERMRQDFISTVSHELRTPLTSIFGSLSLLRQPKLSGDASQSVDLLSIAYRNSERLLKLIDDLLDLQRLAAGGVRFDVGAVSLGELVADVVGSMRAYADPLAVEIASSVVQPQTVLRTDRLRLSQMLINLLSNACRFSPSPGTVRFSASPTGDRVTFVVADDGPGIPLDFQRQLFDRFFQGPSRSGAPHAGSGLGLAIVKNLVVQFGGTVSVDSTPGHGATLTIEIPLVLDGPADPGSSTASAALESPERTFEDG